MNTPNNKSSLNEWVDWLLRLHAQEIDLGLERIRAVATKMQVTRPAPFIISVAGTNGKGSSVAMLASILKAAGCNVGTYTSPHILEFNERIQINGTSVTDEKIVEAFDFIENQRQETKLTYFEFSTLAALTIFNQAKLDVVVLEVGLGGRLDAVNVVDADAALITAIDIDHIDWLGDDRNVIAVEKAGIMRAGHVCVCSDPNPPQSLFDYAANLNVDLSCLTREFSYSNVVENNQAWQYLDLLSNERSITIANPSLQGAFQIQNASGVVALILKIKEKLNVTVEAINAGLQKVEHAGRMQSLQVNAQAWLIDVAHNPQSAQALADYLAQQPVKKDRIAVFSALSDKDMLPMVRAIKPFVKKWVIADLKIPRSTNLEELRSTLLSAEIQGDDIHEFESMTIAVNHVQQYQNKNVLVWGSFFTVSQVLNALKGVNQ